MENENLTPADLLTEVDALRRDRNYRRLILPGEIVIAILSGEVTLHLPDGSIIAGINPNNNLLPTGLTVFVLNEAFDPVTAEEEPPLMSPHDYFFNFNTDKDEEARA